MINYDAVPGITLFYMLDIKGDSVLIGDVAFTRTISFYGQNDEQHLHKVSCTVSAAWPAFPSNCGHVNIDFFSQQHAWN